jgi:hypothetical protein
MPGSGSNGTVAAGGTHLFHHPSMNPISTTAVWVPVGRAMRAGSGTHVVDENSDVTEWLLERDQPAVRSRALANLLDRKETDSDVREARSRIARVGWARDQLAQQKPKGFWESREPKNVKEWIDFLYFPYYTATNWRALVLSDLGLDASVPQIKKLAETLFRYKLRLSSPFNFFYEEMCISANTARMLTTFGYADDPRVKKLFDWLIEDQRADGGWNCSQGTPGTLDVWEPLAAFAALPKSKRSPKMEAAVDRGAEFYLKRGMFREGKPYAPWLRLHYPNHYFYDILVGLDVLTRLGFAGDRRLRPALQLLNDKRRPDGRWLLDRAHPDVIRKSDLPPGKSVRPFTIEAPGEPSKWITLKALEVLVRVERAG